MKRFRIIISISFLFLATAVTFLVLYQLGYIYYFPASPEDRAPEQPVPFSHRIHAGERNIHCEYCHRYARVSSTASVPDVDLCRSCHVYIAADNPLIQDLSRYWIEAKPIRWVRIHRLPDFAFFTHRMHLNAGIYCDQCHGDVAAMDRVERVARLTMGWCLDCHREKGASIDCWTCHR